MHSALQNSGDFLLPISCAHESGSSRRSTSGYFLDCLDEQTKGADLSHILWRFRDLRRFGMDRHEAQSARRCANRRLDRAERELLANAHINYASLAQNSSAPPCPSPFNPPSITTHEPLQKHPKSIAQNHESALTDKPHNPERTQTLGAIIAAQLGSLTTTSPPPRRACTPLAAHAASSGSSRAPSAASG